MLTGMQVMHLERANSEVCSTTAFGLNTCNDMISSTQAANATIACDAVVVHNQDGFVKPTLT